MYTDAMLSKILKSICPVQAGHKDTVNLINHARLCHGIRKPLGHEDSPFAITELTQLPDKDRLIEEQSETLKASEERYRKMLDHMIEGFFQASLNGHLIRVNLSMAKILGYDSPEELLASITHVQTQCYVHPSDFEIIKHALYKEGRIMGFETQMYRKNGDVIWVFLSVSCFRDKDDSISYYEGFLIDITKCKQAEEGLRRAKERAEAANHAKGEFLTNMSHEVRTPLNAILGFIQILMSTPLNAEQRKYLQTMNDSGKTLLALINNILDLSELEAGRMTGEEKRFSLHEVIDHACNATINKAGEKNLELYFSVKPGTPTQLIGDSFRLQQILVNLLDNAIKFSHHGEVLVEVGLHRHTFHPFHHVHSNSIDLRTETAELCFTVRDTGIGIPENEQDRIFDRFTQVDSSLTRSYGGAGIGLTVCRSLVEMMGGRIWVMSEKGKGSTFCFTVKFDEQAGNQERLLPVSWDFRGRRTLLVDGDETSRNILREGLSAFHFDVTTVNTSHEALVELEKDAGRRTYTLMIVDWKITTPDGTSLVGKIKGDPRFSHLPVIVMVPLGRQEIVHETRAAGAEALLVKPVRQSSLFDAFRQVTEKVSAHKYGPKQPPVSKLKDVKGELEGVRVLLVEDNHINQTLMEMVLEGHGIIVDVADNGEEAFQAVKKSRYDAVLMDVQMPVMDGYEATKAIREWEAMECPDGWRVPIIAVTAHTLKEDRTRCMEAGMDDYIAKPFDSRTLFPILDRWSRSREREIKYEGLSEYRAGNR